VLTGLKACEAMNDAGAATRRPPALVAFTNALNHSRPREARARRTLRRRLPWLVPSSPAQPLAVLDKSRNDLRIGITLGAVRTGDRA